MTQPKIKECPHRSSHCLTVKVKGKKYGMCKSCFRKAYGRDKATVGGDKT